MTDVTTSCSCTVPEVSPRTVEPGGAAAVRAVWTTGGEDYDGRKTVTVRFRDAATGEAFGRRLTPAANVRRPLSLARETLDFGRVAPGGAVRRDVLVRNFGPADWDALTVAGADGWLTAESVEIDPPDAPDAPRQLWRVTLTAAPAAGDDLGPRRVTLAAGGETASLVVRATSDRGVLAIPALFFFGDVRPGRAATATVLIRFGHGTTARPEDLEIAAADLPGALAATAAPDGAGYWDLTATFTPAADAPAGLSNGSADLSFGPGLPALRLPVRALVEGTN